MVLKLEKRFRRGWGVRDQLHLELEPRTTCSARRNFFAQSGGLRRVDNYDFDARVRPVAAGHAAPPEHHGHVRAAFRRRARAGPNELGPRQRPPVGGWAITAFGAYQSGFPVPITQSNNNSGLSGSVQRPNQAERRSRHVAAASRSASATGSTGRRGPWRRPSRWGPAPHGRPRAHAASRRTGTSRCRRTRGSARAEAPDASARSSSTLFNNPNFLGPKTRFGSRTSAASPTSAASRASCS